MRADNFESQPDLGEAAPSWFARALARDRESQFVEVHGVPIHYACWNVTEDHKPPLLFVHGFLAHARWWDFIAPFFTDRFRVFAMDFSGMGDSGHRQTYGIDVWRDEILGVANALGGESVTLIGHSFGGARAVDACSQLPERFQQLVAIDSYFHFSDYVTRAKPYVARGQARIYDGLAAAVSHYRLIPEQEALPFAFEHLARHSLRERGSGWGWKFDEINLVAARTETDSGEQLANLKVPLSLIHGEHSWIATRERMSRVAKLVPQCSEPVEIPEARHHIMLDQPLALVASLRCLLQTPN